MSAVGSPAPHREGGPACSALSRSAGEPLAATAAPGRRWLLVEVAGAWGRDAFTDAPVLDAAVGHALVARAQRHEMRIAAIRRPGRARGAGTWRWAIAETDPGRESIRWGAVTDPADLLALPLDGTAGEARDEAAVLVCAHGRHDECCAVRGRVVAAAIAARYPEETWECSHIGGDRFAATMLLLPHGLNYGRVDDLDGPGIVAEYLAGRVAPDGYRGRTAFSRIVQAAQHRARELSGDRRVGAFDPVQVERVPDGWRVVLDGRPPVTVLVEEQHGVPLLTTCRAVTAVSVLGFTGGTAVSG